MIVAAAWLHLAYARCSRQCRPYEPPSGATALQLWHGWHRQPLPECAGHGNWHQPGAHLVTQPAEAGAANACTALAAAGVGTSWPCSAAHTSCRLTPPGLPRPAAASEDETRCSICPPPGLPRSVSEEAKISCSTCTGAEANGMHLFSGAHKVCSGGVHCMHICSVASSSWREGR